MKEYDPEQIKKHMRTYHQLRMLEGWSPETNSITLKKEYMEKLLESAKSIPSELSDETVPKNISKLGRSINLASD